MADYAALWEEARGTGSKIFFADEAHFRAYAELRGQWVLKGAPAFMKPTSPQRGEKASYYSAVCLEKGEMEWMELEGNRKAGTSAAFLMQLRQRHSGSLKVVWDNAPVHRGEAVREYLRTPGLGLRLVNLPGSSPDFNSDEAIWGWRERKPPAVCAWRPGRRFINGSETSWRAWLTGKRRSGVAAGRHCNREPRGSCKIPSPIPAFRQMHIPP